jgi:PAS domain S-box-containing protein
MLIAGGAVLFGALCLLLMQVRKAMDAKALRQAATREETQKREIARLDGENARLQDELRDTRLRHAVAAGAPGAPRPEPSGASGADALRLRKSLETALANEARQRAFFDGALEGMAVLERESLQFQDVNASLMRITGYDAATLATRSLVDLFVTGPGRPAKGELLRCGREGRALMVELTRGDGRTVYVDIGIAPIGTGADARMFAVVRDVSERRLLEQELQLHISQQNERERRLEDANRELALRSERIEGMNSRLEELQAKKDDFVSTVSHELRTPLTSIRSFSEILLDYADADETVRREFLEIIHKECKRLTRLVDDVLDLSRIEADKVQLEVTEFDARDVVGDAVTSMAGTAKSRSAKVRFVKSDEALPVRADRDKLQQLVMNLLGNALKYGTQGGEVVVEVRPASGAGRIEIAVSDDGPGIPAEELERVFEKFRRAREAQHGSSAGTGLGLAISREIVKLHGGRIWAETREEGGARFRVDLPGVPECLRPAPEKPVPAPAPVATASAAAAPVRVPAVFDVADPAPEERPADDWSLTGTLPPLGGAAPASPDAGRTKGELPPIR